MLSDAGTVLKETYDIKKEHSHDFGPSLVVMCHTFSSSTAKSVFEDQQKIFLMGA